MTPASFRALIDRRRRGAEGATGTLAEEETGVGQSSRFGAQEACESHSVLGARAVDVGCIWPQPPAELRADAVAACWARCRQGPAHVLRDDDRWHEQQRRQSCRTEQQQQRQLRHPTACWSPRVHDGMARLQPFWLARSFVRSSGGDGDTAPATEPPLGHVARVCRSRHALLHCDGAVAGRGDRWWSQLAMPRRVVVCLSVCLFVCARAVMVPLVHCAAATGAASLSPRRRSPAPRPFRRLGETENEHALDSTHTRLTAHNTHTHTHTSTTARHTER